MFSRKNKISFKAAALALTASGALLFTSCATNEGSASQDDETLTARVATLTGISSLPVQVAITEGFFEDHGLNVELNSGTDVAAWQTAVGSQFDFVLTNAGSYTSSVSKGVDNTLVNGMVVANDDFTQNMFATKEPIESLEELRGATIGSIQLAGMVTGSAEYLLRDAGLNPDDYQIVTMPYNTHADNLEAGNVDAVLTVKPHEAALRQAGYNVEDTDLCVDAVRIASNNEVDNCSSVLFTANTEWAEQNPEVVERWLAGLDDAIQFIEANPEESKDILQEWTGFPDALIDEVELPPYDLEIPAEQLEPVWEILTDVGTAEGEFPADRIKTVND